MTTIFAQKALLPTGWAEDVRLSIEGAAIQGIEIATRCAAADIRADCVIPGISNSHSHAFQRALAGWTEERGVAGQDNFWTWRERMYELAAAIDAPRLLAIARQVYVEMITRGYTSVAEFHYLHRESAGGEHSQRMYEAIRQAALDAGIRLTYVPVLYERAGFDLPHPQGAQERFTLTLDEFLEHYYRTRDQGSSLISVGIGAHSIRAVGRESLKEIAATANAANAPMHIHVAEQRVEIEQSVSFYGCRPVQWLLENFDVRSNWCLVHATHADLDECRQIANSGAVVCLCPSTEANLGDGIFPLRDYLHHEGQIAIGSDSHICINPFEELRWLEYGQRLVSEQRNVTTLRERHTGKELFERTIEGGSLATGQQSSGLVEGGAADMLTLDLSNPMMAAHGDATRLDALVFSGYSLPIDAVMVGGEWLVQHGQHKNAAEASAAYVDSVARIARARSHR